MDGLRRHPREPDEGSDAIGLAVGVLGALALSVAMIPLRDHTQLHNDNMALALVVPVLIGAVLGGRRAGAASAVVAALCFDFFFIRPYLSLRISSGNDIASFVVLIVVALIAAEIGIRARRGGNSASESRSDFDRLYRVVELAARGDDIDDVVSSVRAEMIGLFGLEDCTFETSRSEGARPRLGMRGAIEGAQLVATHTDFLLPQGGLELPVVGRGYEYGRLVLFAPDSVRAPLRKRLVAIAIADELGLTLATKSVA
jgi:K+-sensing histidine kinase KdpD